MCHGPLGQTKRSNSIAHRLQQALSGQSECRAVANLPDGDPESSKRVTDCQTEHREGREQRRLPKHHGQRRASVCMD